MTVGILLVYLDKELIQEKEVVLSKSRTMLPQAPASKRSAHGYHLASRHHASYHPYYSSSPMNSSGQSTRNKQIESKSEVDELSYLEMQNIEVGENNNSTHNTPSKFSLYYSRSSLSVNNTGSDLEADFTGVSTRTPNSRPPTTPVSSSNCNNSLNLGKLLRLAIK